MNNSKDTSQQTSEEHEASGISAAEQARLDAISAFGEEPELDPKNPVGNYTLPLAPNQIFKQGIPGLPKWMTFFYLYSFAFASFLAAIFAFIAASGDVEFALKGGGIAEIDRRSFTAMGAFTVLAGMVGFLQFYLRVRNSPTVARKPLNEIAMYFATTLAAGLFVLIIWPSDVFSLYVTKGTNTNEFLESSIWISSARSKPNFKEGDPVPWLLELSNQQQTTLKTKERFATCQTDISLQIGPLHWERYRRRYGDNSPPIPNTIDDIRRYCKVGIVMDSISASASAKALLKTQMGERLDFTDAEIAAAEGSASDPYQLSARARYFLFKTAPQTAATIALETQVSPSDLSIQGWNGGYQAVDNRIAAYECDDKYAKFLISKGVRPTSFEVKTVLNRILLGGDRYDTNVDENPIRILSVASLPTSQGDPGAEVRSANSPECATLFNTWIKATPLGKYEAEASEDFFSAHNENGHGSESIPKKVFDEIHKSVMLHSGSAKIFSRLGPRISYDSTLANWMEKVNPSDVSRKIQLNENTYKMWCDGTGYCSISQENARILLKAFIKP